jgi:hypothetical protein
MKRVMIVLIGLAMMSSLATAQVDPDENSMGIYFDTNAAVYEHYTYAPFEQVCAYLVVVNPTSRGVSGWECMVDVVGPCVAQSWTYAGGGLNVYDAVATGLFAVGVGPGPLALVPVNNVCVLATWCAYIMAPPDVVTFTVLPFPGSVTFPDSPGYVDGDDVGIVVPCGVSTGYPYGPYCAAINLVSSGIIASEDMTWGSVKALYQ